MTPVLPVISFIFFFFFLCSCAPSRTSRRCRLLRSCATRRRWRPCSCWWSSASWCAGRPTPWCPWWRRSAGRAPSPPSWPSFPPSWPSPAQPTTLSYMYWWAKRWDQLWYIYIFLEIINSLNYGLCYFHQTKMLFHIFASPLLSIRPSLSLSQVQGFPTLGSGPHLWAYGFAGDCWHKL